MKRIVIFTLMATFAIIAKAQNMEQILSKADSLSKVGNYTEEIALIEQNMHLFETDTIYDISYAYDFLSCAYSNIGDYEKTKNYCLKTYDFIKPLLKNAPDKYAFWLSNNLSLLTSTYINLADYKNAVTTCKKNIELIENNKDYFENYAAALAEKYGNLSFNYLFTKNFDLSEQAADKALGIDSTQTWIKTNLAHALLFQGKTADAEKIYDELANTIYGEVETYAATLLDDFEQLEKADIVPPSSKNDFARIKINLEKPNESIKIYKQFAELCNDDKYDEAIALLRPYISTSPKQHAQWAANAIGNIGGKYYDLGDYAKAEKFQLEALAIQEKVLGKEHLDYANSLSNLGVLFNNMGNYAEAEKFSLEALNIREKVLGKEHPDYATTLDNLGGLYHGTGDYAKAEKYYLEALNIREKVLGQEHPDYATSLNNLGSLYHTIGNYFQAEKCYLEALNIREKVLGKEHPDYAQSLSNLGVLYDDIGDYIKAEKYLLEAKNIKERTLGKEHPDYALSLNNLGILYYDIGDYIKAEKYLLEAKNIEERTLGKEHPDYTLSLNNLGVLYYNIGYYTQSEKFYMEALSIEEEVLGKEHPNYARSLAGLGGLYDRMGDYAKAEKYHFEAKNIFEKTLGKEHPDYVSSAVSLDYLYRSMKEYGKATILNNEVCELTTKLADKNFTFLTEQQRNQYWKTQENTFSGSYSLSWFYPLPSVNGLNYNNTLFTKGLLLRTTNGIRDAVYSSKNQSLISNFEQLGSLRQQIDALQQKGNYDKDNVQTLENQADSLDKAVTQASQAYRDLKTDMQMTWQDVQKQLKPTEAAVEFVSFRLFGKQWTDSTMYAALVLRPGIESPAWIPLCEQRELESVLQTTVKEDSLQIENLYNAKGKKLYQLVWQALEKELPDIKTVYYSPSGLLYKIAFNAMPTDKENVLLSDKYNLYLLSSTREIANLKKEMTGVSVKDTTVVYGGLTYDMRQLAENKPAKQTAGNSDRFIDRSRNRRRDLELPDADLRSAFSAWKYLAGTKTETEQIVSSLKNKHILCEYYTDNKGTEESFKQLSGTETGVIHLATHGFFLPDIENEAVEDIVQRLGGNKEKPFENPLLRSGLIMSGANNQWLAKEYITEDGMEDGILTADEIARLNLTKTKLVVMSACETGLGDVKNSEGVFGLQRAFKLAGVESLIMSLWKVPDDATSELMTTFYQQWLSGQSKQNAFKIAQQKVREKYVSPYYWAAFVMMD